MHKTDSGNKALLYPLYTRRESCRAQGGTAVSLHGISRESLFSFLSFPRPSGRKREAKLSARRGRSSRGSSEAPSIYIHTHTHGRAKREKRSEERALRSARDRRLWLSSLYKLVSSPQARHLLLLLLLLRGKPLCGLLSPSPSSSSYPPARTC